MFEQCCKKCCNVSNQCVFSRNNHHFCFLNTLGVDVESAVINDLDPEVLAEGNPNWEYEYDVDFGTNQDGGGVFGSDLWRIAVSILVHDILN